MSWSFWPDQPKQKIGWPLHSCLWRAVSSVHRHRVRGIGVCTNVFNYNKIMINIIYTIQYNHWNSHAYLEDLFASMRTILSEICDFENCWKTENNGEIMTLTSVILHANNSLIETRSSENFSIFLVVKVVVCIISHIVFYDYWKQSVCSNVALNVQLAAYAAADSSGSFNILISGFK